MKADADLTAVVGADSIYPQSTPAMPTFPFIKYGAPSALPRKASCVDGVSLIVAIHSFSKGRVSGTQPVESAEDHAARISATVASVLDGRRLDLGEGVIAKVRWTGSQLLADPEESSSYHGVANFRVQTLS